MNKRNNIIVSIVGITIVLLALLGITYAYYLTRIEGNTNTNSISITTADLKLEYSDGNGIVEKANFMPGESITKTFSVKNTGENKVTGYTIVLEDIVNELSRREDLKYSLYCTLDNGTSCGKSEDNLYPKTKNIAIIYANDIESKVKHNYELVVNYIYLDNIDQSDDMGSTISGKINIYDAKDDKLNPFKTGVTATDNASLAYNVIENARLDKNGTSLTGTPLSGVVTSISGKQFNTTVTTTANQSMRLSSSQGELFWTYADGYTVDEKNGITLTGVKTCVYNNCYSTLAGKYLRSNIAALNSNTVDVPKSTPGLTTIYRVDTVGTSALTEVTLTKISITQKDIEESILTSTLDDYGTSYYFRGNVQNNYVNFAGMCWRIVRIDGNGNTKLILEDQDEVCSTIMNGNWDIEASDGTNIALNSNAEPYRSGNFGYDDSTDKYKMSYLNPVDNPNRAMVNAFKYFQTNTLTNKISSTYENKSLSDFLVSGNWCLNNKAYSDSVGTTLLENPTYTSTFYYDSLVRLYGTTTKEPTLKCPVETMETFGDNTTPMYVGTLTADEIVYAGGKVIEENPNYYLINKYKESFYSLSPSHLNGDYDSTFCVDYDGTLDYSDVNKNLAFRPSISLASSAVITGGEGTLESPYIIG